MIPLGVAAAALVVLVGLVGGGSAAYINWAHNRRGACIYCDHVAVQKMLSTAEAAAQAITLVLAVGGILRELALLDIGKWVWVTAFGALAFIILLMVVQFYFFYEALLPS